MYHYLGKPIDDLDFTERGEALRAALEELDRIGRIPERKPQINQPKRRCFTCSGLGKIRGSICQDCDGDGWIYAHVLRSGMETDGVVR